MVRRGPQEWKNFGAHQPRAASCRKAAEKGKYEANHGATGHAPQIVPDSSVAQARLTSPHPGVGGVLCPPFGLQSRSTGTADELAPLLATIGHRCGTFITPSRNSISDCHDDSKELESHADNINGTEEAKLCRLADDKHVRGHRGLRGNPKAQDLLSFQLDSYSKSGVVPSPEVYIVANGQFRSRSDRPPTADGTGGRKMSLNINGSRFLAEAHLTRQLVTQ
ncbi:hypothetical protein VUR80DRAFT_1905 [Thermomyces stellatus]